MITDQPNHARGRSPLRGPLSAALSFASCALNIVSWRQNLGTASSARRRCRILWCFLAAGTLAIGAVARAQSAVPVAIPLAEVATEAESASTRLREMQA